MALPSFEEKNIHYAYYCIRDFFDNFGLSGARHDIEDIFKAAVEDTTWKKKTPAYLLYYMEKLEGLSAAAFVIHYSYSTIKEAVLDEPENGEPDISLQDQFLNSNYFSTVWNNFPRNLTARQYHDPYRAIKKFCTYRAEPEWKKALKALTEYALSDTTIDELCPGYNILTLRLRLLQLIEACHLLDIRVNSKKPEPRAK